MVASGLIAVELYSYLIQGYIGRGLFDPKFDWLFTSVPQKHANNNTVLQPRGKGLGGSSHVRG